MRIAPFDRLHSRTKQVICPTTDSNDQATTHFIFAWNGLQLMALKTEVEVQILLGWSRTDS